MMILNKKDVILDAVKYLGMENGNYEVVYAEEKKCWYVIDLEVNFVQRLSTKDFIEYLFTGWFNESMMTDLIEGSSTKRDFAETLKDFYKHVTLLELILSAELNKD